MMLTRRLAVAVLLGLAPGGCPGEAAIPGTTGDAAGEPSWYPLPDLGADGGGGWIPTDSGPHPDGVAPHDGGTPAADQSAAQPDLPVTTTAGGACPCAKPLVCIQGKCRKPCVAQPCNGPGGCAAAEACVKTDQAGVAVCVPGVAVGGGCTQDLVCAGNALCLTTSPTSPSGTCLATCTVAGSTCPGGGTCYAASGTSCFFCY